MDSGTKLVHYDIGIDLDQAMLDGGMTYTCASAPSARYRANIRRTCRSLQPSNSAACRAVILLSLTRFKTSNRFCSFEFNVIVSIILIG